MSTGLPIGQELVAAQAARLGLADLSEATIGDVVRLSRALEGATGIPFVHMEMGVPGLPAPSVGIEAEVDALREGVAQAYPPVDGLPVLKEAIARFIGSFAGVEVAPKGCVPTVGSMQAGLAAFMVLNRCVPGRDRVLFVDPGFPVQKAQLRMLGYAYDTFDVYAHRGQALRPKLEGYLREGRTSAILYSNPNNPSWVCLTEEELEIVGELSDRYGVPVVEDLAYFAMDFREDLSHPDRAPYQATVARYGKQWLMLLSASKIFSYAGQRAGCVVVSDALYAAQFDGLRPYFSTAGFGPSLAFGAMNCLSAGVASSVQHGFAAMLNAASAAEYDFVDEVREYGRRAVEMKRIFTAHGFTIVYDRDGDRPLADGFYFTVAYPGLDGDTLLRRLLQWGISGVSLGTMGSARSEGLRACVSHVYPSQFEELDRRLRGFHAAEHGA